MKGFVEVRRQMREFVVFLKYLWLFSPSSPGFVKGCQIDIPMTSVPAYDFFAASTSSCRVFSRYLSRLPDIMLMSLRKSLDSSRYCSAVF